MDLNDYYVGLIQLDPNVYNRDNCRRMLGDINYDPFCNIDEITGIVIGELALLRKDGDNFFDIYNSRFKNELKYQVNKTNKFGIKLLYVKPFKEIYNEDELILDKDEVMNNCDLLDELIISREYYIGYSKEEKNYDIVILNDTLLEGVREEYYDKFYRNDDKTKQKK
jgi:hypothetical protein